MTATVGVVGREAELSDIWALIAARAGGVLLTGEPGIGKTMLWAAGVAEARSDGYLTLEHRSARAETAHGFSGLVDLLSPVVGEALAGIPEPRRHALAVALLIVEPGDAGPAEPHAVGLAVLDVLQALAAHRPVLVALDDVQWLDRSTASVLSIALRRLREEPVVVLATMRDEGGAVIPSAFTAFEQHRLAPLDLGETHRLLRDRLGLDLPRPTLAALHRAAGGNPYFALELGRDFARTGELGVPDSLRQLLGGLVERLSPEVLDVLLDAAAVVEPTVELLLSCREPTRARAALAVAAADGIVQLEGQRVRFAHPLLASICYDRALPWERQAAHARLAHHVVDTEERVRHLALAAGDAPDAALADELERAGKLASVRGATAAAAELTELAVQHTPAEPEEVRRARRFAAGRFHHLAGDLQRAGDLYAELVAELPPGPERAAVLLATAVIQRGSVATLRQALEEADDDDALAAHVLGALSLIHWLWGEVRLGLSEARAGLARAEKVGDARLLAAALAKVANIETWSMDITPGLLERGLALERALGEPPIFYDSPTLSHAIRLVLEDEHAAADRIMSEYAAAAEERGDEHSRGMSLLMTLPLDRDAGRLAQAAAIGQVALDMAGQMRDPLLRIVSSGLTAAALIDLGRLDEATSLAANALALARSMEDADDPVFVIGALGRAEMMRGNLTAANELLDGLPERLLERGHVHPHATPWPDAIEVLIGLGKLDRAERLLCELERIAARANRWSRSVASRCRGLLSLATGDPGRAEVALEQALDEAADTYPIERGRALIALGVLHRHMRHTRVARQTLAEAVTLLDGIGALAWRDLALAELSHISGRRSQRDELTPAELRVARLAAAGRQNKEIAATLFITVTTVEAHLSRVYRKLGVRSRTELAGRFGDGGAGASNE